MKKYFEDDFDVDDLLASAENIAIVSDKQINEMTPAKDSSVDIKTNETMAERNTNLSPLDLISGSKKDALTTKSTTGSIFSIPSKTQVDILPVEKKSLSSLDKIDKLLSEDRSGELTLPFNIPKKQSNSQLSNKDIFNEFLKSDAFDTKSKPSKTQTLIKENVGKLR